MNIMLPAPVKGHIEIRNDGSMWWIPDVGEPRNLSLEDSFCGAGIFETGPDDPFYKFGPCPWHDDAYNNRAYWESQGWDRESIDKYFLDLMLFVARDNEELICKAYAYYSVVRSTGWIFYYRHPGYCPGKVELRACSAGIRLYSTGTGMQKNPFGPVVPETA